MSDHPLHQLDPQATDSENANPSDRLRKRDIIRNAFGFSKSKTKEVKKDSVMLPGSRPTSRQSTRSSSGVSSASSYSSGGYQVTSPMVQEENRSPPLNVSRVLEDIFPENLQKPTIRTELPHLQQRIERTAQLVYCNTLLLQDSPPPPTTETGKEAVVYFVDTLQGPPLDKVELDWLDVTKKDPMEADRLRWLANRMVEKFVADINKDSDNVGEIVSLGSVLAKEPYRKLLSTFIKEFEDTPILNVDILQGLVQLLQAAPSGYLISDDLIKILGIIRVRLEGTHQQSTEYSYRLTLAVSRILDVMADHKVQDVDRVLEHEPLSAVLSGLKGSSDPYLMYQACYAFQALQYVPDNETALHAVLRHSTDVANGLAKTFGVLKLDLSSVLDGLASMYRALESTIEVANSTYEGLSSLRESGRGVLDSLKEGLGSGQRRPWYPAVKAAYAFAQAGQLKDLKQLLVEAPCRRDTFFQWGICQLLGEIAVDPVWDISARQQSVSLLGHHLYNQDQGWGCDESVRSWILTIITNFANTTDQAISTIAKTLLQELEQDQSASLQYRYPLSTQLRIPATSPLLAKMQDIPYLEYELHKFRLQRLDEANLPVYIPPMAKANLQASDDDLVPLMDKVQEFLSSDRQVMLILGDSGAGKSTFNKHLEVELLTTYKHGGHVPLFINLPTIDRPDKDLVTEHLRTNNFSEEQIKELKLYRRLVLICDGYDESQLTVNLHTTNHFNRSGQWHIKMVISCRTQFLGQEYRSRFMPEANSHYNRQAVDLFQEAVIAPFSKEQIKDYVEQYVPLEPRTWTTMDYMDRLTTIPNLMDLVRNPFLLSLSLEALPGVTEGKQDLSVIKITRVQLYDTFVTHWLDVNSRRLLRNALSKEDREILDQLLEAGFTLMGIDFSTRLASAIFEHQDGNPVVQYVHLKDRRSWRAEFFGPDPEVRLLRESSPLTRTGSQFRFLHRSMLEYFLSCAVFDPCDHRDNGQLSSHSDSGTATALSLDTEGPLFKRNLLSEPSVIQFLCERVKQYPEFETQLLAIVEQSKSDSTTAIAAANAITILVRAGVRFNSADLRGIRIPGADLSDGQFDSALLQGADLTGVNFSGCWLRDVNFSNTLMAGAQYGELPYLKEVDHIDSCAYSSNGRMMAVGLRRGDIEMYDTTTWTKIHGLGRRKQDVWNMAFSPNDQHIVSRSDYSILRLWDISRGRTLHLMQGHTKRVVSMVFSPCGKQIASSSHDKTVRLWSSETGKEMLVLEGHTDHVNVVKYAPDGRRLVSGSNDGTVRFWDPKTGNAGPVCDASMRRVYSIDYSPDGRRVVSGHGSESSAYICLWDADTGDLVFANESMLRGIRCIAFSPNGQRIVSSGDNPIVHMCDSSTGRHISRFSGHTHLVNFCAFSPDGLQIASRDTSGIVRLWDARSRTSAPLNSDGNAGGVSSLSYSIDGRSILSCIRGQGIQRWKVLTGESEPIAFKMMEDVRLFALSPDGRQIATATGDRTGTIQIWSGQKEAAERILVGRTKSVNSLMYSPCGRWILSTHRNKNVRLLDLHDADSQGHVIFKPAGRDVFAALVHICAAFSPDGCQVAVGSLDGLIQLFDTQSKNPCNPVKEMTHTSRVRSLAFSPDGQCLVLGSKSGTLHFWDLQSATANVELKGHGNEVLCITYSPCGRWLLSGSNDRTIRLWQLGVGELDDSWSCVAVVRGCSKSISCLAWNPVVPMEFVSGCDDGSVRVWKISIGDDGGVGPVRMHWGNDVGRLCASGLIFKGAVGLSPISQRLLVQRSAVDDSFSSQ